MKLSAYKDLESSKRAQTLGRIIVIAGAHLAVIGGAFIVTKFGGEPVDEEKQASAGVTWSSQSPQASQPTVDGAADSLFDPRAGDLSGYNAGEGNRNVYAANASANARSEERRRFAPRRPDSGEASDPAPSIPAARQPGYQRESGGDDEVLQPLNRPGESLFPARSSSAPSGSLSSTIEYTVQNGDSLWGISRRFGVAVSDITAANPGIKANAIRVGETINIPRSAATSSLPGSTSAPSGQTTASRAADVPNGSIYTVKAGDSLSQIASRQGVTVAELKAINSLSTDTIRIGQELVIPTNTRSVDLVANQHRGPSVTIEAGDTLDKYAAIYGVSVKELMQLNNITDPRRVRIGQTLLIPAQGGAASSPSATATSPQSRQSASPPPRSQPRQPAPSQPTLDSLESEPSSSGSLPTLDDEFGDEDLDEQPLVPIAE